MTRNDRAALIRRRYAAKCGYRRWQGASRDHRPMRPKPRPDPGNIFPIMTSGWTFKKWIETPDPEPPLKVEPRKARKGETAVTRIAKGMYAWNRMEWDNSI